MSKIKHNRKILYQFLVSIIAIFMVLVLPGCKIKTSEPLDPATFDNFSANIFNLLMKGDEMSSNYLFEHPENYELDRYEPSLPTPSAGSLFSTIIIDLYFSPLHNYDYNELNFDQQMTYLVIDDIYNYIMETASMGYLKSDYLGSYLGYQAQLPLLLVQYNLRDELDIQNYLKYLELMPETFKKYVDFEIEKADNGYGMPNFVIDKVVDQCESFIEEIQRTMTQHFMVEMFNNKIDSLLFLTDEQKIEYKNEDENLINTSVVNAYAYVRDNLPALYDRSVNNMGLAHYVIEKEDGSYEIGKKYYEALFKHVTGYDMPVDEAISYLQGKLDSKYVEYVNLIRDDNVRSQVNDLILSNKTPEEMLSWYTENIYQDFPTLNLESLPNMQVNYIDKSMEEHFSPAAYMTSAIDNYTNEYIYLNNKSIHNVDENGNSVLDYNYLYTTIAHEGFPGHMYQNIYFKNTNSNLLRKVLKSSGYVEGWATYAELYAYKFLENTYPHEVLRALQLNDEFSGIVTARLDMGIHYEGWTPEEAEAFLGNYLTTYNKNSSNYNPNAITSIYQQLVEIPTNSQKYYFTYLKLEDMYNYAVQQSGNNFNPIDFHKIILDCGPVPLKYIEEIVNNTYNHN